MAAERAWRACAGAAALVGFVSARAIGSDPPFLRRFASLLLSSSAFRSQLPSRSRREWNSLTVLCKRMARMISANSTHDLGESYI
mmetsp:Transcript_44023/g.102970  ORF Transcript_44023/g.102970 Transcript_44023/m.102970 type:complete len:85 (-) Transcript_44023:48-302(-)